VAEDHSPRVQEQGVSRAIAHQVASLPPVSSLLTAVLGENPVAHLLGPTGALTSVSPAHQPVLAGTDFFPKLIASAFHDGLEVVFSVAAGLSVLAAIASLARGGRYVHVDVPPTTKGQPHDRPDRPAARGAARDGLPERLVDMLDETDDLLSRAAGAIANVRSAGGHIGYVRVAFEDADLEAFPPTSGMGRRVGASGRALHNDSLTTAVHERVAPEPGDMIVRKVRVGAFSTTDLDEQLRDRGVDTLILAGTSTSGDVLSTVRDASDRDYRVVVLFDATADREADVHAFLTERIFPRQAEVITVAELAGLLGCADPG
jgi:nicotinamidase-related amidase